MPGSTGISLIAQATRERSISGGVIADAIGAVSNREIYRPEAASLLHRGFC